MRRNSVKKICFDRMYSFDAYVGRNVPQYILVEVYFVYITKKLTVPFRRKKKNIANYDIARTSPRSSHVLFVWIACILIPFAQFVCIIKRGTASLFVNTFVNISRCKYVLPKAALFIG